MQQAEAWALEQQEAMAEWEKHSVNPGDRNLPKAGQPRVVGYNEDMEAGARPIADRAAVQWHPLQGGVQSKLPVEASGTETSTGGIPALPPVTLLAGPRHSGKSAALVYAVHRARSSGWISVFVPDSFSWLNDSIMVTASESRPGKLDQPDLSSQFLAGLLSAHADQLGEVPQRRGYSVGRYLPADADEEVSRKKERLAAQDSRERARLMAEASARGEDPTTVVVESQLEAFESGPDHDRTGEGYTLRDVAEWGVRHPQSASDAVLDLLEELRLCVEFPVLLAVDGANELYEKSIYPFAGRHWWPG